MKITVLSSLPPIKGISKYTAGLLGGMPSEQAVEVLNFKRMYPEKLYPGGTKDNSLQPLELPNVHARTFLTWYNPFGWLWAGLSAKGDVIHAQWWSYVLAPVYLTILGAAKLFRRKKIILTIHNVKPHERGFIKNIANNSVYRLGDHFIVHSDDNKKVFARDHGISEAKISVIPHGILVPDAPISGMTKAQARGKLNLSKNDKVILFFGIIREYKGLDTLLEALAAVRKEIKNVRLVIAGKPWEGWEKYERIITDNNLQKNVGLHLEFIPEADIETYFAAADVVVLPYRHFDSASGAGSLALPFKKAMVVTNVGSLPQLVRDERAVCEPDNPHALAKALTAVLKDETLRAKLEEDSYDISKQLSWDTIAKQTIEVYKNVSDHD